MIIPRYLTLVAPYIVIASVTISFKFCSISLFGIWNSFI